MHWPDLGPNWNDPGWHVVPVDASRGASCLRDLPYPTYVLIMPDLYQDMHQRPHGLLEVARECRGPLHMIEIFWGKARVSKMACGIRGSDMTSPSTASNHSQSRERAHLLHRTVSFH